MSIFSNGAPGRFLAVLIVLTASIAVSAPTAFANSEDVGGPSEGTQGGGLTETTGITGPAVTIDFDALATGATSLGAITMAYPGSALAGLGWSTQAGTGTYDSQTSGNALAPNPDGSGDLYIAGVSDTFGNPDTLTVGLSAPVTEFGFDISDWAGPVNIAAFSGATQVGTLQVDASGGDTDHFFQANSAFDEVQITLQPDNPGGNWVISGLYIPQGVPQLESVSTLSPAGLATLSLVLVLLGLMVVRGRTS